MHLRWAWLPAAILVTAGAWVRFGAVVAVLLAAAGFVLGLGLEWRARRRMR